MRQPAYFLRSEICGVERGAGVMGPSRAPPRVVSHKLTEIWFTVMCM